MVATLLLIDPYKLSKVTATPAWRAALASLRVTRPSELRSPTEQASPSERVTLQQSDIDHAIIRHICRHIQQHHTLVYISQHECIIVAQCSIF